MKNLLMLGITFFITITLVAQNKDDYKNWLSSVEKDFPEIDKNSSKTRITSGSVLYNRIRYNLLSDKYFKPVFGQTFDNLSDAKRNKIAKKLRVYKAKKGNPWAHRIDWYLWGALNQTRAFSQAKNKVEELRIIRSKYSKELEKINSTSITFRELKQLKNMVGTNYKNLLPSEINHIKNKVNSKQQLAANNELINRAKEIKSYETNIYSVRKLNSFKTSNYEVLKYASSDIKDNINRLIESKRTVVLQEISKKEIQKLSSLNFKSKSIAHINKLWDNLNEKLDKYKYNKNVESVFRLYKQKKTEYILNNIYLISDKVNSSGSIKSLNQIEDTYLTHTNNNSSISKLESQINSRKAEIKAAIAAKEQQYFNREIIRKRLLEEARTQARQYRSRISSRYDVTFPTFDQLFEVKNLASLIQDKAYESDQDKFINYLSRLGYALKNQKLFSDHNTFINHKGHIIETWRIKDKNSAYKVIASFIVENAPQDIIEAYILDLSSNFRKRYATEYYPWSIGEDIEKKSPYFVKSGSTLYNYNYEDGKFEVSAWDNTQGIADVMAERIGINTIKITPYTNLTSVEVKKGDKIHLKASGSITLGVFAGKSYPNGISGFRSYNIASTFNHGCLIGKIGKGNWFYVGKEKIFTAKADGYLRLRINDDRELDNDGFFKVTYTVN